MSLRRPSLPMIIRPMPSCVELQRRTSRRRRRRTIALWCIALAGWSLFFSLVDVVELHDAAAAAAFSVALTILTMASRD